MISQPPNFSHSPTMATRSLGIPMRPRTPRLSLSYQWSFTTTTPGINHLTSSQRLPDMTSSIKMTSPSQQHKPYSSSSLWNPRQSHAGTSKDRFLTLTPLEHTQKPVTSTLPYISVTPRNLVTQHPGRPLPAVHLGSMDNTVSSPCHRNATRASGAKPRHFRHLEIAPSNEDNEHGSEQQQHYQQPFYKHQQQIQGHQPLLLQQQQHRNQQQQQPNHQQKQQNRTHNRQRYFKRHMEEEKDDPDRLPDIVLSSHLSKLSPRDDLSTSLPSDNNHRSTGRRHDAVLEEDSSETTDGLTGGQCQLWKMPELNRKNTLLGDVADDNWQDERTLFSNQQSAYYSRLTREHTVIPPPVLCNRRSYDVIDHGGDYVREKQYVKDHYSKSSRRSHPGQKDDATFPGVYKTHMKRHKVRVNYLKTMFGKDDGPFRSMLGKDEQRGQQLFQFSCPKCKQTLLPDQYFDGETFPYAEAQPGSTEDWVNSENELTDDRHARPLRQRNKIYTRFVNYGNPRYAIDFQGQTRGKSYGAGAGDEISAQFCDVLGRETCQKCREYYAKQFKLKMEKTFNKVNKYPPANPPSTPTDPSPLTPATPLLPSQGLQKVVIRVRDKSGAMAVAAVGVNMGANQ